jgi:hypothetical protein
MATFKLEDFIGMYPSRPPIKDEFNEQDERDFYDGIVEKKEIDVLRLNVVDEVKKGELFKQQLFIQRFLSPYTPYDKMLLYHGIGTGKAYLPSVVSELSMDVLSNYKQTIVLTKPSLVNDIIKKIAEAKHDKYVPSESMSEQDRQKQIRKNVKQNYKVMSFSMFAKEVSNMSDDMLKKSFNNRIIFIDEAHNIKEHDESELSTYKILHHFVHVVQGCKIVLMTATPMKDSPSEIVDILNLLLPKDKQLNKQTFNKEYITDKGFVKAKATEFKQNYLRGLVSYVRSMSENIKVEYQGSIDKQHGMKYTKLVQLEMDEFQSDVYKKAYEAENPNKEEDDTGENVLWINSRQSSMFVYPNGTYGSGEVKKKMTKKERETKEKNDDPCIVEVSKNVFQVTKEIENFIKKEGTSNDKKLEQLKKLSIKFHKIISDILKNPNEKVFVYSDIVSGGGAKLFSAILHLFDFSHIPIPNRSDGITLQPGKRFLLITGGSSLTPAQMDLLVGRFNEKDNMHGEYVQVIIGSKRVGEGVSFKHVKRMYVLTPFWNTPTTDQAIGRVIRADSHTDFVNPEDRKVKIFLLTAIPKDPEEEDEYQGSIDFLMYKRAEYKDIQIKSVERLLKESAVDCSINYDRNVSKKGVNNSRECDYMECKYTCDYVDPKYVERNWRGDRIMDTYNLYYAEPEMERVKTSIKNAFKSKNAYDFYEFYNLIRHEIEDISFMVISRALNEMIINNDIVFNRLGFPNYLREDRNLYFLTDDPLSSSFYTSYYYALHPNPETNFDSFENILTYQELTNMDNVLAKLIENQDNVDTMNQILDNLPQHVIQKLIQTFFIAHFQKSSTNIDLQNHILQRYETTITKHSDVYILKLGNVQTQLPINATHVSEWKEIGENELRVMEEKKVNQIQDLQNHPIGYYARITNEFTGKDTYKNLKIIEVREPEYTQKGEINKAKASSDKGQTCGQGEFKLEGMIRLYYDLLVRGRMMKIDVPEIPIIYLYKIQELISSDKFKEYLKQHIQQDISNRRLVDVFKQKSVQEIKDMFIKVIDQMNKADKKIGMLIQHKSDFSDRSLVNIINMLRTESREKLFDDARVREVKSDDELIEYFKGWNEDDVNRLGNVLSMKSPSLCPIIQEWFKTNGLYIT